MLAKRLRPLLAMAYGLFATGSVLAAGDWRSLRQLPSLHFDATDWKLLRQAVRSVVESSQDDALAHWSNPANDHSGTVSSLKVFTSADGQPCRVLQIESQAEKLTLSTRYDVCRDSAGVWRDVGSGAPFTGVPDSEPEAS